LKGQCKAVKLQDFFSPFSPFSFCKNNFWRFSDLNVPELSSILKLKPTIFYQLQRGTQQDAHSQHQQEEAPP
jgi:hypothetical protein